MVEQLKKSKKADRSAKSVERIEEGAQKNGEGKNTG
jgi:hypothetical protein